MDSEEIDRIMRMFKSSQAPEIGYITYHYSQTPAEFEFQKFAKMKEVRGTYLNSTDFVARGD